MSIRLQAFVRHCFITILVTLFTLPMAHALSGLSVLSAVPAPPMVSALSADTAWAGQAKTNTPDLDAMIGQMVFVGFKGMDIRAPEMQPFLASLAKGHVGGVILFEPDYLTKQPRNIRSVEQVRALVADLQRIAPTPLFVAVDQEGGTVQRFKARHGVNPMPPARDMGKGTPEATYSLALAVGRQLHHAGINLNFAPVVDIDVNPASAGLGDKGRAYSAHAEATIAHAGAFATAMRDAGLAVVFKHFPGQGSATTDTHFGMSDITSTWSRAELAPYRALLRKKLPAIVLTSSMFHREMDTQFPCSLSPRVVTDILRGELGWDGVAMSGDLQMKAVSDHFGFEESVYRTLAAGTDIPLVANNMRYDPNMAETVHALIRRLVQEGRLTPERIAASYERILRLKEQVGIVSAR